MRESIQCVFCRAVSFTRRYPDGVANFILESYILAPYIEFIINIYFVWKAVRNSLKNYAFMILCIFHKDLCLRLKRVCELLSLFRWIEGRNLAE